MEDHYDSKEGTIIEEYTVHVKTYRCPGAQFWHTIKSHDINIYGGPHAHLYPLNCGTRQTQAFSLMGCLLHP